MAPPGGTGYAVPQNVAYLALPKPDPDSVAWGRFAASRIESKHALRLFYLRAYEFYKAAIASVPARSLRIEIGSGAGFVKTVIPEMVTTDLVPYEGVDRQVDATRMDFPDGSLGFIGMLNTLHHIPDCAAFFREASRCLAPGGRLVIVDQYRGLISEPVLRLRGDEPFDPDTPDWQFASTGPMSGANGALAWVVFHRDAARFRQNHPNLCLLSCTPFHPLLYWLSGGLNSWNLLPGRPLAELAKSADRCLERIKPLCSFAAYELERT